GVFGHVAHGGAFEPLLAKSRQRGIENLLAGFFALAHRYVLNKFNFKVMPTSEPVKPFLNMFRLGPLDTRETTRYFPCAMANPSDRLYDIRVLERNVRKGLIARKDVEKYL